MADLHGALSVAPPVLAAGLIGYAALGSRAAAKLSRSDAQPPMADTPRPTGNVALLSPRLLARRARIMAATTDAGSDVVPSVQQLLDRPAIAEVIPLRGAGEEDGAESNVVERTPVAFLDPPDLPSPDDREVIKGETFEAFDSAQGNAMVEDAPRRSPFAWLADAHLGVSRLFRRAPAFAHEQTDLALELGPADAAILQEPQALNAPIVAHNEAEGERTVAATAGAQQVADEAPEADAGLLFPIVPDELAPTRPIVDEQNANSSAESIDATEPPEAVPAALPVVQPAAVEAHVEPEPVAVAEVEAVPAVVTLHVATWFERLAPGREGASAKDRATVARSLGDIRFDWAADLIEGAYPSEEAPVQTAFVYAMGAGRHYSRSGFFFTALENDELQVRIAALDVVSAFHAASVEWTIDALRSLLFDGQIGYIAAGVLTGDSGDMRAIVEPIVGVASADALLKKAALYA